MKTKSLIETNPFLKDATQRKKYVTRSVRSSCGVEGIKPTENISPNTKITHRKDKKIYKLLKQRD